MTTKLEQAAREVIRQHSMECLSDKTVDALRESLAEQVHTPYCKQAPMCKTPCGNPDCVEQAEQKPVAWALTSENGEVLDCISHTYKVTQPCTVDYDEPLYAAPVRIKDLTDTEIRELWSDAELDITWFARAVIAKYKEKNK